MPKSKTRRRRESEKRQRKRMYIEQGGKCYYCGQMMYFYELKRGETAPDDMATIEHLDSRLSGERGNHQGEFRRVMACLKCNNARGKEEEVSLGKERLWELSGRRPLVEDI